MAQICFPTLRCARTRIAVEMMKLRRPEKLYFQILVSSAVLCKEGPTPGDPEAAEVRTAEEDHDHNTSMAIAS